MKKILGEILMILLLITSVALASGDGTTALDAFNALTGQMNQTAQAAPAKSSEEYLDAIMAGNYVAPTAETAAALAAELPDLVRITTRDMAAYASVKGLSVAQVRNSYYRALSQVLRADMMAYPATGEEKQNLQQIFALFLEGDELALEERESIRAGMNQATAWTLANGYNLPQGYVEFLIMNENWDDADWTNDDAWKQTYIWAFYEDSPEDLLMGSRDNASSTRVAQLQEKLIALGYLTGKADGIFGAKTQEALIQYQRANGLPATGIYDDSDVVWMTSNDVVARWHYEDSFMDAGDHSSHHTKTTTTTQKSTNTTRHNTRDNTPDNTPDHTPDHTRDHTH